MREPGDLVEPLERLGDPGAAEQFGEGVRLVLVEPQRDLAGVDPSSASAKVIRSLWPERCVMTPTLPPSSVTKVCSTPTPGSLTRRTSTMTMTPVLLLGDQRVLHVGRLEAHAVGRRVVRLLLAGPLGGDPLEVVARPRAACAAASQPSTSPISAGGDGGGRDPAVPGLDRDAGAAGEHVLEVQRALVRRRVDDLGLEVVVGAGQRLAAAPGARG